MLMLSISSTLAMPTPTLAHPTSSSCRRARAISLSFFDSLIPSGLQSGSSSTAAATTGPASGARPASPPPPPRPPYPSSSSSVVPVYASPGRLERPPSHDTAAHVHDPVWGLHTPPP